MCLYCDMSLFIMYLKIIYLHKINKFDPDVTIKNGKNTQDISTKYLIIYIATKYFYSNYFHIIHDS